MGLVLVTPNQPSSVTTSPSESTSRPFGKKASFIAIATSAIQMIRRLVNSFKEILFGSKFAQKDKSNCQINFEKELQERARVAQYYKDLDDKIDKMPTIQEAIEIHKQEKALQAEKDRQKREIMRQQGEDLMMESSRT